MEKYMFVLTFHCLWAFVVMIDFNGVRDNIPCCNATFLTISLHKQSWELCFYNVSNIHYQGMEFNFNDV